VGLKFDRVGAGAGRGVDVGVGGAQAAVVRLPDFGNDEARPAAADFTVENGKIHVDAKGDGPAMDCRGATT